MSFKQIFNFPAVQFPTHSKETFKPIFGSKYELEILTNHKTQKQETEAKIVKKKNCVINILRGKFCITWGMFKKSFLFTIKLKRIKMT